MEVSLDHLLPGTDARVSSVRACGPLAARLRKVGVVPGVQLRCADKSRNGQVTALELDGVWMWLPTRDLEKIRVVI